MASESKSRRSEKASNGPARRKTAAHGHRGSLLNLDHEQSARLMMISAVVGIIALAMGFIAFGYWNSVVKPRNRTVLEAEGVKVSYAAMKRRMAYEFFQNINYQQVPNALPEGTYLTLLDEIIVLSRAETDLGITVPADEFDNKLRTRVGVGESVDTKTFADALRRQLDTTGLHESEYRRLIRAELLTQKVKDHLKLQLPLNAQQAKVEVIATNSEDDAQKASDRIKAGEDWATVAKDVSAEVDVQSTGGLHDYAPQGSFNAAYDDYVFSAALGEISPPLQSPAEQFFIVRVVDRAEQPVTDDQKPRLTEKSFKDWLSNQQDQITIVRDFDAKAQAAALTSVLADAGPRLQQESQQQQQQFPVQQQPIAPAQQPPPSSGEQGGQSQPNPDIPAPAGGDGQ